MSGPLNGVRVLAAERVLAGPYESMLLGDLGAEVLKIEPTGGEQVRRTKTAINHKGGQLYILAYNRNKKSVVRDLMTDTGLEAFYDLVKISDMVWDNNRPGVMSRLRGFLKSAIHAKRWTGACFRLPFDLDLILRGFVGDDWHIAR